MGATPRYGTTLGDSMLFASAAALIIALFNERGREGPRPPRTSLRLFGGHLTGHVRQQPAHRLVELVAILATIFLMSGSTPLKRRVARTLVVTLPVLVLYLGAGWNRPIGLFAPVQLVRSIADSKSDNSIMWRDLENINDRQYPR